MLYNFVLKIYKNYVGLWKAINLWSVMRELFTFAHDIVQDGAVPSNFSLLGAVDDRSSATGRLLQPVW